MLIAFVFVPQTDSTEVLIVLGVRLWNLTWGDSYGRKMMNGETNCESELCN